MTMNPYSGCGCRSCMEHLPNDEASSCSVSSHDAPKYTLEEVKYDRESVERLDAESDHEAAHQDEDMMRLDFLRSLRDRRYTSWSEVARIAAELVALAESDNTRWYA